VGDVYHVYQVEVRGDFLSTNITFPSPNDFQHDETRRKMNVKGRGGGKRKEKLFYLLMSRASDEPKLI
jgi:hypothetical protein